MSVADNAAVRQHRFFTALFDKDWTPQLHVQACYGYITRDHAEEAHAGEVELVAEKGAARLEGEAREAWLFGFRFRDTGAPEAP
jgi:hypothetical protein